MSDPYANHFSSTAPGADGGQAPRQPWEQAPSGSHASGGYGEPSAAGWGAGGPTPYQQPSPNPYGPTSDGYQQSAPYGSPQQGWQGYGPAPTPARTPEPLRSKISNQSIALIVVGLLCGTIPAILGIIALTQVDSDPASAQSLLKWGWILCGVILGLLILAFVLSFILPFLLIALAGLGSAASS